MRSLLILLAVALTSIGAQPAFAQFRSSTSDQGVVLGKTATQRWQVGAKIKAVGGPCQGLFITIPVPTDWPEQSVKVVDEKYSKNVVSVTYRMLEGGVQQMVMRIPRLPADEEAEALVTFEVTTNAIEVPADTSIYKVPKRMSRDIMKHLAISPHINSRHSSIRDKARELANPDATAWKQVEAIYDWVRDNTEYENLGLKGAVSTLREGRGGGEDQLNLFIALCRASKIPARTVWVQGHYYAEFYLEDNENQGHWFPCQVVGNREFGSISDIRPILQKGDNILVPEKKDRQRFVPELVKGKAVRGSGRPAVTFVRELLPE